MSTRFWRKFEELKEDEAKHDNWQNPELRDEIETILCYCEGEENNAYFDYIG